MLRCFLLAVMVWVVLGAASARSVSAGAISQAVPGVLSGTGAGTGTGTGDRQRVRQTVAEVLDSREFAHLGEESSHWFRNAVLSTIDAIVEFIASLPAWLVWVIVIWMILTLLAILAHLIWTLVVTIRGGGVGRRRVRGEGDGLEQWLGVRDLDFASVYERAQRFREVGQWTNAIRYYYVAALLRLRDKQCLRYHQAKTNHDYVREMAPQPGLQRLLATMTRSFDSVAYQGTAATTHEAAVMDETLQRLIYETNPTQSR